MEKLPPITQAREPRRDWYRHASCKNDVVFIKERWKKAEKARLKSICLACPVFVDCWLECQRIEDGLGLRGRHSFVAGATPIERTRWPKIVHQCPICDKPFIKQKSSQQACCAEHSALYTKEKKEVK